MNVTLISVLMTTYNCAPYIRQSILSILTQTYKDFELLIVDDGSTDNTEKIVKQFDDVRIKFIKCDHIGRSAALNFGIEKAKFDIVALQDADDISHPKRLETQLKHLKNEDDVVFTRYACFKSNRILYVNPSKTDINKSEEKFFLHGHFNNSSSMFYKNLLLEAGGYNENLPAFEDYDFWLRVHKKVNFKIIPDLLHYVRLRDDSLSKASGNDFKKLLYNIQQPYYNQFEHFTGIDNQAKRMIMIGWREFFYGSKSLARKYWIDAGLREWSFKIVVSYLLSFFSEDILDKIKDKRIRLRLEYQVSRLFNADKIKKEFNRVQSRLSE